MPSGLVCGTPIGMPWKLTSIRTCSRADRSRTALVNASQSRSGSRPLSSKNGVSSASLSRCTVISGSSTLSQWSFVKIIEGLRDR